MCDVVDRTYKTVDDDGKADSVDGVTGLSVDKLITTFAGPTVRAAVTFTQTSLSGNSRQALLDGDKGEIGGGSSVVTSPYQNDEPPPAIFFGNGIVPQASYIRPLRRAGDDRNSQEYLTNGGANFIHILVHTSGRVLYPTLSAGTPAPGKTGTTVRFETDLRSPGLHYTWRYGDSEQDGTEDSSADHLYTEAGRFQASVVVTDDDTSFGQSPFVTVKIGDVEPDPTAPDTPGGNNPTGKQTEGPVNGGGTRPGGALSPVPGNGAGGGTGNATGTPQPTPGAGNGTADGTRGTGAANGTASTSARASAGSGRGDLVQGLALYAPEQAAGAARSQAGQAEAAALRAGARDDASTDLRWLLWLIPIGLIGVGVFTERRRPRRQGSRT